MQKYKIVASKSQKKYTLIVSADSESEAKEKLHKDGYSLLSISEVESWKIEGNKFIFQVEKDGELQNGVIVGQDIYKVYKKLKDDLGYHIVYLYPHGDEAENNAEKKQLIMDQLDVGYKLQQQKEKTQAEKKSKEESFYLKKQLDETYELIEKVIIKLDNIITHRWDYSISEEKFLKIEAVYEKLKQIKKTTNLAKLREIWEKALTKVAEIEVENIQLKKDDESKRLLKETNSLLKEIGSDKNFKEKQGDLLGSVSLYIRDFKENIFPSKKEESKERKAEKKIDKWSYSFLKTLLLLEKYNEKLKENTKDIQANIFLFVNIFSHSEEKEKILLKRSVIKQNITLLKAKKNGSVSSYTWIKKWISRLFESLLWGSSYMSKIFTLLSIVYIYTFLLFNLAWFIMGSDIYFYSESIKYFIFFFLLAIFLSYSKRVFLLSFSVVFLVFLNIFMGVNF